MKRWIPIALVVLCSVGWNAQAGFFFGASYISTDAEFENAVDDFSTDDSGYKFFGGFNIIRFVGIEASYRDLGTHTDTVGSSVLNVELEGYDLSVRGTLPLGKWSVFAKAGYGIVDRKGSIDTSSVDEDDAELFYGVGLQRKFSKLFLRAEWEEYDVESSLDSFSIGAGLQF